MAHIEPRSREELPELAKVLDMTEAVMGFVPNSALTMAHMPQLTMAYSMLAGVVFGADLRVLMEHYADTVPALEDASENLTPEQVQLIAFATSLSAGCRYCQAHTSAKFVAAGASIDKLNAILHYEDSDLFAPAEKALIALALAAGQTPNDSTPAHFAALKAHYSDRQIVQIVGVISMFGFLNRWNDTMATALENKPVAFATEELKAFDWELSKHA